MSQLALSVKPGLGGEDTLAGGLNSNSRQLYSDRFQIDNRKTETVVNAFFKMELAHMERLSFFEVRIKANWESFFNF